MSDTMTWANGQNVFGSQVGSHNPAVALIAQMMMSGQSYDNQQAQSVGAPQPIIDASLGFGGFGR